MFCDCEQKNEKCSAVILLTWPIKLNILRQLKIHEIEISEHNSQEQKYGNMQQGMTQKARTPRGASRFGGGLVAKCPVPRSAEHKAAVAQIFFFRI
jgi:hypothetical protein